MSPLGDKKVNILVDGFMVSMIFLFLITISKRREAVYTFYALTLYDHFGNAITVKNAPLGNMKFKILIRGLIVDLRMQSVCIQR